jgi:hypothetical protein
MIPLRGELHPADEIGPQVHRLTGCGVDHAGRTHLAQKPLKRGRLLLSTAAGLDGQGQVGTLEAGDQLDRRAEAQLGSDVRPDVGRGGGGKRGGRDPELRPERGEAPVIRSEIVSPLADAVGLVHHQPRDPGAGERLPEGGAAEPLGRHIEEGEPAARERRLDRGTLRGWKSGVQRRGGDPPTPQHIHLVFHQGDERGHDERGALKQERGQLEAQ